MIAIKLIAVSKIAIARQLILQQASTPTWYMFTCVPGGCRAIEDGEQSNNQAARKNVLFLVGDDLRPNLGSYSQVKLCRSSLLTSTFLGKKQNRQQKTCWKQKMQNTTQNFVELQNFLETQNTGQPSSCVLAHYAHSPPWCPCQDKSPVQQGLCTGHHFPKSIFNQTNLFLCANLFL